MHKRKAIENTYTHTLTISIPAYNDAASLPSIVQDYISIRHQIILPSKLLIINDGSSDNTNEVMQSLMQQYDCIEYIDYINNRGFGITIKEVITAPTSEWILFISGDNQFPVSNILTMQQYIENHDFIIGRRINRNDTWRRILQSKLYNGMISLFFGVKIRDVNSIIMIKKSLVDTLQLQSKSAFIHAEIFLNSVINGAKYVEVPIQHHARLHGEGSGGKWQIIFPTIKELFYYKFVHKTNADS